MSYQSSGLDVREIINLEGQNLTGENFSRRNLRNANLKNTNLTRANLTEAILTKADLTESDLTEATLRKADLTEAILKNATLKKAKLLNTKLINAHLEGAHLEESVLREARLFKAHLQGAHLEGADLRGANLEEAHLEGANLTRANLREDVKLIEAYLEGATLINAHLEGADLQRAHLERAILTEAHLEGATLINAHLEGADLQRAHLENIDLERAHLEGAHLERANLRGANLRGANLTGAFLQGANLTNADLRDTILDQVNLSGISLSYYQRAQISASNLARQRQQQIAASNLARQQQIAAYTLSRQEQIAASRLQQPRINNSASASPSISNYPHSTTLTFSRNQFGSNITVIHVPPELLKPKNNSANKSCPSFMPLYEQVMVIDLDGDFIFDFQGQNGRDMRGLTRIVFDKLLPIYTNLFFKKSGEFMLLKENVDMVLLNQHTNQIIKLAKAANAQIQLEINPELIKFLSLQNPPESISTRQNFNALYANFKAQINSLKEGDPNLNVSNYLINNRLKPEINAVAGNLDKLNRALKEEILFRKTLSDFGFTSFDQYHNMAVFIKNFWNISNRNKITVQKQGREVRLDLFVPKLEFDIESFKRRIKIIREDPREVLNLSSIPAGLIQIYPAFGPLLEYILNPTEDGNENRKTFVKYATGTEYSPDEIVIKLTNDFMHPDIHNGQALYGHSCFASVDLYIAPRNYNGIITGNNINTQLKATVSNKSNIRVAER
jgi:uncharacterized protein YjbI with pentapeptide repeats